MVQVGLMGSIIFLQLQQLGIAVAGFLHRQGIGRKQLVEMDIGVEGQMLPGAENAADPDRA
ncbi:hypothetical protein D3C81_2114570 [compost metagenome]